MALLGTQRAIHPLGGVFFLLVNFFLIITLLLLFFSFDLLSTFYFLLVSTTTSFSPYLIQSINLFFSKLELPFLLFGGRKEERKGGNRGRLKGDLFFFLYLYVFFHTFTFTFTLNKHTLLVGDEIWFSLVWLDLIISTLPTFLR